MPSALILIGGHLSTAPRAVKEARALADAGWAVDVRGVWYDELWAHRDELLTSSASFGFAPVADLRIGAPGGTRRRWLAGAAGRVARARYRHHGAFSPALLGFGVRTLLSAARARRADLTIVHGEGGLWIATRLAAQGLRVGVDFEDWFSEDLMPEHRTQRPVAALRDMERQLMRGCVYRLATSRAMARAMAQAYGATEPAVVYNSFPESAAVAREGRPHAWTGSRPSLHWFSQAVGPGRGLEPLFEALRRIAVPVQVHLRGEVHPWARDWLQRQLARIDGPPIMVHRSVDNAELPARIAEHDIGLALESPYCENKQVTASNKLFQYLQAGLAVIATDTAGQREVMAQCPGAGTLVPADDPEALAEAITRMVGSREGLEQKKRAAALAMRGMLAWEQQADRIVTLATRAVRTPQAVAC